jgi:hypothetical protein
MARLRTLLEFLESMPADMVQVAVCRRLPDQQSVTIVGDWFAAESVSASIGRGYQQTIFTRHAPAVQKRIALFDQEFEDLLGETGSSGASSRDDAIATLRQILSALEATSSA